MVSIGGHDCNHRHECAERERKASLAWTMAVGRGGREGEGPEERGTWSVAALAPTPSPRTIEGSVRRTIDTTLTALKQMGLYGAVPLDSRDVSNIADDSPAGAVTGCGNAVVTQRPAHTPTCALDEGAKEGEGLSCTNSESLPQGEGATRRGG
jgi:hypothetical protein